MSALREHYSAGVYGSPGLPIPRLRNGQASNPLAVHHHLQIPPS